MGRSTTQTEQLPLHEVTFEHTDRDMVTGAQRWVVRKGYAWDDLGLLVGGTVVGAEGYSLQVEKDGVTYQYDVGGDADVLELGDVANA
jgi:hypothetical protein